MQLYTNLQPNDIQSIIQLYNVGNIISIHRLSGGLANTNYLVETSTGKYVLTICDNKSFEDTQILADILLYLNNNQFETSKIIYNIEREYVSLFQSKPVLLKEYIPGNVQKQFNHEILKQLGGSLGQLHQLPPPECLPKDFPYGEKAFNNLYKLDVVHSFVDWLSEKHQYIKSNLHPDLTKCFIHGDLFPSNVIISENQTPVIMDFEEACLYFRIFDLGMAIVGLCSENGIIDLVNVRSVILGYRQVVDLSTIEKEHIKAFIVYAAVTASFWRFRQFNILFPSVELADSYLEMKNLADQIYSIPNSEFVF